MPAVLMAASFAMVAVLLWQISGAAINRTARKASPPAQAVIANPGPKFEELDTRALRSRHFTSTPLTHYQTVSTNLGMRTAVVRYFSEGSALYALETLPDTPAPLGGYPTVIFCHGYVNPSRYRTTGPEYRADMEMLSRHGYAVIKPDYRGQGDSPGSPEGAYFSDGYVIDVLSLVDAIKQTSYLNGRALGIVGHSMGGYVALKTAVTSPDIKATVLLAGAVGSPQELVSWNASSVSTNPTAAYVRDQVLAQHGSPSQEAAFWNNSSPLNFLENLNGPVQIHVGTADRVVPPVFSRELEQKLAAAHEPSSYFEYAGADHILTAQRGVIWPRMLGLFDSSLKPATSKVLPTPTPAPKAVPL